MTVDAEGGLWCCHWDGWRVTAMTRRTVDRVIELPVPRPTSVAFGGPVLAVSRWRPR